MGYKTAEELKQTAEAEEIARRLLELKRTLAESRGNPHLKGAYSVIFALIETLPPEIVKTANTPTEEDPDDVWY